MAHAFRPSRAGRIGWTDPSSLLTDLSLLWHRWSLIRRRLARRLPPLSKMGSTDCRQVSSNTGRIVSPPGNPRLPGPITGASTPLSHFSAAPQLYSFSFDHCLYPNPEHMHHGECRKFLLLGLPARRVQLSPPTNLLFRAAVLVSTGTTWVRHPRLPDWCSRWFSCSSLFSGSTSMIARPSGPFSDSPLFYVLFLLEHLPSPYCWTSPRCCAPMLYPPPSHSTLAHPSPSSY